MTSPAQINVVETDLDQIAKAGGRVVIFVDEAGKLDQAGRRANRLTKGAIERLTGSEDFGKMKPGDSKDLAFPTGMAAAAIQVVMLPKKVSTEDARKAGAAIGSSKKDNDILIMAGNLKAIFDVMLGAACRDYAFIDHKTDNAPARGAITVMATNVADTSASAKTVAALTQGVFFTRDLVSAPANVLTTTEFADQLHDLKSIGLDVDILEEAELEKLGMRTLLSVGQGSDSPSKVAVMQWNGGGKEAPFALIGKGVVFDTGGISLKPAAGMEGMTMDMGGAGVVAGVMKSLALRAAKANVVGIVGLVENMPSGNATRPGDVVTSMKGDTVEIINTDAEGRLVLCDVMWYAQERFKPTGMIDLATLTGAIIIGLGHDRAGVFSNDDPLCKAFLKAADAEVEGAWRMPLGASYDKQLKSQIADMKNVGGRPAGSVTAAQFLQRFVKEDCPWIHLDIAGVASTPSATALAPKGATGWGVLALNRLIADNYES